MLGEVTVFFLYCIRIFGISILLLVSHYAFTHKTRFSRTHARTHAHKTKIIHAYKTILT